MKKFICAAAAAILLTSCSFNVDAEDGGAAVNGKKDPASQASEADAVSSEMPAEDGKPEKITVDTKLPDGYKLKNSFVIDGFKTVLQNPELPTGCEVTSLTQVLNFYGFDVDKEFLCDNFLPMDCTATKSMDEAYIGDPHWEDGFGCNAPVIVKTANDYFEYIGSDWYGVDLTGCSFEEMLYQVEQGRPAVVWTTIDQVYCTKTYYPQIDDYFNGMQHCLTVYGYDKDSKTVHCADPLKGNVAYNMDTFELLYGIMDKQTVVLIGNESSAGVDYTTKSEKDKWLKEHRPAEEEQ